MHARLAAALVLTLLTTGCTITAGSGGAVTNPSQSQQQLDALTVASPQSMAGYSRERFPHWNSQDEICNTREYVLKRDGTDVRTDPRTCRVTGGRWLSPYDGRAVTDPNTLDIDHVVALANAWRSGANGWNDDKRAQFANDITAPQLIAVSRTVNRAKGDQDPSQWKPPIRSYWCRYARDWVAVKHHWQLTVTASEKTALADMLGTCRWESSAPPTSPPGPAAS